MAAPPPPPPPPVRGTWASRKERSLSGPELNVDDVPESMPGAACRANPAEREFFEQRCKKLWNAEVQERNECEAAKSVCTQADAEEKLVQMEKMFPNLDPELVRSLCREAAHPEMAMETLLALSMMAADPTNEDAAAGSAQAAPKPPPKDIGLDDEENFPVLGDRDGWQVVNRHLLEKDQEEELGSGWRDTAKDAATLPAPKKTPKAAEPKKNKKKSKDVDEEEDMNRDLHLDDYELRQNAGNRRAARISRKAAERRNKVGNAGYASSRSPAVQAQQDPDGESMPSEDEI